MTEFSTLQSAPLSGRLTVESFECVRRGVQSMLAGNAFENPLEALFLNPNNLQYIFYEYVRRYQNETGWQIDDETHRLDAFTQLIHDAYITGMCKYNVKKTATRIERAEKVQQWNEDTINAILFEAIKETRKKVNYLRRVRDPLYGQQSWDPITLAKCNVDKIENRYRSTYRSMSRAKKLPFDFAIHDC